MSILIKDMEMPENCYECPLAMEYYSTLFTAKRGKFRNDYACVLTHKTITSTKRNRACPLVPVPPHGDLIDRDALSKSLDSLCDRVCHYSKAQRKVMCGACPLGDAFAVVEDNAPTIIPAEEGEC